MRKPPASPLLLAVIGVGCLCGVDAIVKHLGATVPVPMVTLLRYATGSLFAAAIWLNAGRPRIGGEAFRAHSLRALVIIGTAAPFFWALGRLPLAEVIAISFIAPLLVPFAARLFLKERLRPLSLVAVAAGFVGVVVAVAGGATGNADPGRLAAIGAVLFSAVNYALSVTLIRARAAKDGAAIVGLLAAILPALLIAPVALAVAPPPPLSALPWALALGALGTTGIAILTLAYARAEAQLLAPTEFTALGWAAAFGYLFWNEVPRPQVLAGAVVIIAACLLAAREERRSRVPVPPPPA